MITMRTVIHRDRVEYTVENAERVIWSRSVKFGKAARARPGGYSFKCAAFEQERQGALAAGPGERVKFVERRVD